MFLAFLLLSFNMVANKLINEMKQGFVVVVFLNFILYCFHSFITHDGNKLSHQVVFCYVFISIIFQKKSKSKYDLVHLEDR